MNREFRTLSGIMCEILLIVGGLSAVAGCRSVQTTELRFEPAIVTPAVPVLRSLEVRDGSGRILTDGNEIHSGQRIVVTGRGPKNLKGRLDAFGQLIDLSDNHDGLYWVSLDIPDMGEEHDETLSMTLANDYNKSDVRESEPMQRVLRLLPRPVPPPPPGAVEPMTTESIRKLLAGSRVQFRTGDAEVDGEQAPVVLMWRQTIVASPESYRYLIVGYADERGDDDLNAGLGENRAEAVRKLLTDQGVGESQLTVRSEGKAKAKPCLREPEVERDRCLARDRRAELFLLTP